MVEMVLPEGFADLLPFVAEWDLPSHNERYARRLSSSMEALALFHAAVRDQLPEVKRCLDAKPASDYSPAERRLGRLAFAWVVVAEAVEVFRQPRVPDSTAVFEVVDAPEL